MSEANADYRTGPYLSKDSVRAVGVVFEACRVTGASLALAHRLAAMVAEELERIEASANDGRVTP